MKKARSDGSVRVIAALDAGFTPENRLSRSEISSQRRAIGTAGAKLLADVDAADREDVRRYDTLPFMALDVTPQGLAALDRSPHADAVAEDVPRPPLLSLSRKLVQVPLMEELGYDGDGQTIAVLDTGVEKTHSFLTGKVIEEACYSQGEDCPDGSTEQTGAGSGVPCPYSPNCAHGTHVAGIAAGKGTTFSGVAKEADVMAVQVFSRVNSQLACGSMPAPCPLSWDSDQIAGLERVYELSTDSSDAYDFASVNISIGGSPSTSSCDGIDLGAYYAAVQNLLGEGIPTVIAAGNDGESNAVSQPGCLSNAVTVGSTTKNDSVSSFSNMSSLVDVLAPGSAITSSVTGDGYAAYNGTSMSAPHVAGAWALLKEQSPSASAADVLAALKATGKPIKDLRISGGLTKPRVRIASTSADLQNAVPYDAFSSPRVLTGNSASHAAHNVGASEEANEPNHGGSNNAGGASIWYEWTAPVSSKVTVDTAGSDFDTLLSIYTGNSLGALDPVAANDDEQNGLFTSSATFEAVAGTTYRLAVDGYKPAQAPAGSGDVKLHLEPLIDSTPPSASSMTEPHKHFRRSRSVEVAWTASKDSQSGVAGYALESRWAPVQGVLTGFSPYDDYVDTSTTIEGDLGYTYCFRVAPHDLGGNYAPASAPACTSVPLDERDPSIERDGSWTPRSDPVRFEETYLATTVEGSSLTLDVVDAKRFGLLVTKCRNCGSVRLFFDGTPVAKSNGSGSTVSLRSRVTRKTKLVTFQALPGLSSGTLEVVVVSNDGHPVMIEGVGVSKV